MKSFLISYSISLIPVQGVTASKPFYPLSSLIRAQSALWLEGSINPLNKISLVQDFVPMDLVKERVGEVKNKVLEGLKGRWLKPIGEDGRRRRNSMSSIVSSQSKRDRDSLETDMRTSRPRVTSPAH